MRRPRRPHRAALAAVLLWSATCACAQAPAPASPPSQRAMPLEVVVNGARSGTWVLVESAGVLYAPRDAFEEWRLQLRPDAPSIRFKGQEYVALSAIPGFKSKVDFANQSVELLFSPQAFATLRMTRELEKRPPPSPVLPSVFFNYDLSYQEGTTRGAARSRDLGVLGEAGWSTRWGVLTNSATVRNLTGYRLGDFPRRAVRLETTFTHDFPEDNRTLRIGDTTTRGAMWGRDTYYGGVRFGTNFALTPGLIAQPLPVLGGLSSAPSTVELYVNDVLRSVSNVPPGPFVIDNMPILTGNGEARLVVRDLLGRETVIVQPFFSSSQMLAPGLTDWTLEAGRVRRDLGMASNNYGPGFAAGTYRSGVSDVLTVEGRAEGARKLKLLGAGLLSVLPWQVLARAALVASHDDALGTGGHWLLGLEHQGVYGGVTLEMARSTRAFREVGQELASLSPIKYQFAGSLTYAGGAWGTLGVGFAIIERFDDTRISTVSGNYSAKIGARSTLTLTASHALAGGTGSAVGVSLLVPLDDNIVASATANSRSNQQDLYLAAVRNPGIESDVGWRVLAGQQQDRGRAEGGLYYQSHFGNLMGDASISREQKSVRLGATGGVVIADGNVFATRRFEESFALAEVSGYPGVGIGLGSNVLARTDADGVALIPRLLPYISNSIRIDPRELPINAELESIEQSAVPAWRSGVKVVFPVRSGRGALLKIVLDDGAPAPAGGVVTIDGDKEEFYVARRGEAFVTGLKPGSRLQLRWNAQHCPIEVVLPPDNPDEIARVGPIVCKGVTR